jgi:hypothetical protein
MRQCRSDVSQSRGLERGCGVDIKQFKTRTEQDQGAFYATQQRLGITMGVGALARHFYELTSE